MPNKPAVSNDRVVNCSSIRIGAHGYYLHQSCVVLQLQQSIAHEAGFIVIRLTREFAETADSQCNEGAEHLLSKSLPLEALS